VRFSHLIDKGDVEKRAKVENEHPSGKWAEEATMLLIPSQLGVK
jgi:hypothetical protein